jgi:hypothetical protein
MTQLVEALRREVAFSIAGGIFEIFKIFWPH